MQRELQRCLEILGESEIYLSARSKKGFEEPIRLLVGYERADEVVVPRNNCYIFPANQDTRLKCWFYRNDKARVRTLEIITAQYDNGTLTLLGTDACVAFYINSNRAMIKDNIKLENILTEDLPNIAVIGSDVPNRHVLGELCASSAQSL